MKYPTITLWQPHASLIFSGHKKYETRSWPCPKKYIGQKIAIHAGKNMEDIEQLRRYEVIAMGNDICGLSEDENESCRQFIAAVNELGGLKELPLGAVLGTVTLQECILTQDIYNPGPFGDFSPGRYAWRIIDPMLFDEPIPAKGSQGFWLWEKPD